MEHSDNKYIEMFLIMVFAGLLSTMNVWADKFDDIRFSLNDIYMSLLMCGWMFLFMGILDKKNNILMIGIGLVVFSRWYASLTLEALSLEFLATLINALADKAPKVLWTLHTVTSAPLLRAPTGMFSLK
jgi:hypothetical protein